MLASVEPDDPQTGPPYTSDPNRPSALPSCPTCKQRRPQRKPDGWGQMMDWWDCWPCRYCGMLVCNMPVFASRRESEVCYVQHMAQHHPEVFTMPTPTAR
jgi:hypothetical protein